MTTDKTQTVEDILHDITESVSFCIRFCAIRSKPIKVLVVVTCDDGLSHEYERHVENIFGEQRSLNL